MKQKNQKREIEVLESQDLTIQSSFSKMKFYYFVYNVFEKNKVNKVIWINLALYIPIAFFVVKYMDKELIFLEIVFGFIMIYFLSLLITVPIFVVFVLFNTPYKIFEYDIKPIIGWIANE